MSSLQMAKLDGNVCAIYARTSSPNQRMNFSIGEQVNRCWSFCRDRGWLVRFVFIDECYGGGTIERPKFKQMLEKAKKGEFKVIVFWKLDRFCRSLVDLVNIERSLKECSVGLCSTTEYLDTATSIGRFNFRSIASVAELEREMIGERARMGIHAMARMNKWPNPHPPLGYDKDDNGRLITNQKEVEIVKLIFSKYVECQNMPQIAYELNQESIPTKKGKKWTVRAVADVLSNEIYIGNYHVAGVSCKVPDYQILDDGLFEAARSIRNRYARGGGKRYSMSAERRTSKINDFFDAFLKKIESGDIKLE